MNFLQELAWNGVKDCPKVSRCCYAEDSNLIYFKKLFFRRIYTGESAETKNRSGKRKEQIRSMEIETFRTYMG